MPSAIFFTLVPSVIMLSVVILSVVMLSVVMMNVMGLLKYVSMENFTIFLARKNLPIPILEQRRKPRQYNTRILEGFNRDTIH